MRVRLRHVAAVVGAGVALAGVGCGSDDSNGEGLPPASVAIFNERLDEIARRFDDATDDTPNPGACSDIQSDSFKAIADAIANLPSDVDPDVESALKESFRHLQDLTEEGCAGIEEPQTDTETTPEETTPEVTETETVPEQTETQTTPQQSDGGTGNGNSNGNGKGNGNGGTPPGQSGGGVQAPGD